MRLLGVLLVVACSKSAPPPAPPTSAEPAIPIAQPVAPRRSVGPDDSTLTPDAVLETIQASYMVGIRRCYKDRLKVDAEARGKVALAFKVDELGKTVEPAATGFEKGIDACITAQMPSWTFPIPKDQDGEPTEAAFRIMLQLVPE